LIVRCTDGARAEDLAAAFLAQRRLKIVERNWKCRRGEIDIVARDGDVLVFVEVRLRRHRNFGGAAESITAKKRVRMVAAADHYLASLDRTPACRFDAILLDDLDAARIEWLKDVAV
jgi:putative endonuclease